LAKVARASMKYRKFANWDLCGFLMAEMRHGLLYVYREIIEVSLHLPYFSGTHFF
jgi:hypothetical protein